MMSFYEMISEHYDVIFPVNPKQVEFVRRYAGKRLLDMAAGTGGLAITLAKEGYKVTATDLEQEMTAQMSAKKEQGNVPLEIHTLDMRDINRFKEETFHTIVCLGNSLVHLESQEEVLDVLKKTSRLLTEQGQLIIQIVNYDRILKENIQELPIIDRESIQFFRTYEWREPKIRFHGKLIIDNQGEQQIFQQTTELLPITSQILQQLLKDSGFRKIQLFGSFQGDSYQSDSPAIIAVAVKGQ